MIQPVYILIPVHNRRSISLDCLAHLQQLGDLDRYHIVVIDDGSIDGTKEAVAQAFPAVELVLGDGNLWWTGGICLGMEYAIAQGAEHILWMNDDTLPLAGTIDRLLTFCRTNPKTITTAQCYSDESLRFPTYGGQIKRGFNVGLIQTGPGETNSCDCMSGNLVCFPRSVVETIGYPEKHLMPQYTADIVYTWEAKKVGFELTVLGDAIAICEFNPDTDGGWSTSTKPMLDRWRQLRSPKSSLYPSSYWRYCQSFFGVWAYLLFPYAYGKLLLFTILRFLLPLSIMRQLRTWKIQAFG
jgi:GT2 family glycosyltransferase